MRYLHGTDTVVPEHLTGGFFEGWPSPPTPAVHLRILQGSRHVVVARANDDEHVVGFVTAVGDGVLSAYISLLEVLPAFRGRGVASELVRRLLGALGELYMVDVVCDPELVPFYRRFGLQPLTAMARRRYDRQSGAP